MLRGGLYKFSRNERKLQNNEVVKDLILVMPMKWFIVECLQSNNTFWTRVKVIWGTIVQRFSNKHLKVNFPKVVINKLSCNKCTFNAILKQFNQTFEFE